MIKYEDILEARDNLHEEIIRTPMQTWRHGSKITGKTVKLKVETLQRTGSFKPRGAWNRLRLLRPPDRKKGVICASAGNHAQGVAFAANLLGIKPTIVMPEKTPEIKIIQTRLYGEPDIVLYGKNLYEAAERSREIQKEKGFIYIHPYDDDAIISGQGTMGLEILEQWPDVDTLIVPVGGGGLIAGIAVAALTHHNDIRIVGVQSENSDAATRSMEKGERVFRTDTQTIADGINVSEIGERPYEILKKYDIELIRVTEAQICSAIAALSQTAKLVVEPAGAVSAAAIMFRQELFSESKNIVCVLSGANINTCCFANVLSSDPPIEPLSSK